MLHVDAAAAALRLLRARQVDLEHALVELSGDVVLVDREGQRGKMGCRPAGAPLRWDGAPCGRSSRG
jgi:hypothetical protein